MDSFPDLNEIIFKNLIVVTNVKLWRNNLFALLHQGNKKITEQY
jgi:hypothetical protein